MNPLNLRITPLNPAGAMVTLPNPDSLSEGLEGNWTFRWSSPLRIPTFAALLSKYPDQKQARSRKFIVEVDPSPVVVEVQFVAKTRYKEIGAKTVRGVLALASGSELSPQSHSIALTLYLADFVTIRGANTVITV